MTAGAEQASWLRDVPARLSWIGQVRHERERGTGRTHRRQDPRAVRVIHGVPVQYTPHLNGDPDPGEVVWTWVPYRDDPNKGKDRPVVIIGRTGEVLAGVPVTSKDKGRVDHVAVGTGEWDKRRRPSWAKVDRLITFHVDDVRKEGAVLPRGRFNDVIEGLARYHDLVEIAPNPVR